MSENFTTVVIGASQGLGLSFTKRLAEKGAGLALLDQLEPPEDLLGNAKHQFYKTDASQVASIRKVFSSDMESGINHLVYFLRGKVRTPFTEISEEEWDLDFSLNLKAAFFSVQAALPKFSTNSKERTITFVSSISADQVGGESVSYHASKAGLNQLIKYLAVKLGPHGIRVNGVQPGFIVQDRHWQKYQAEGNKDYRAMAEFSAPLRRVGRDADVIESILFLMSPQSSFITGQILKMDGGLTLQDQYDILSRSQDEL